MKGKWRLIMKKIFSDTHSLIRSAASLITAGAKKASTSDESFEFEKDGTRVTATDSGFLTTSKVTIEIE